MRGTGAGRFVVAVLALAAAGAVVASALAGRPESGGGKSKRGSSSPATVAITSPEAGFSTAGDSLPATVAFTGASSKDWIVVRVNGVVAAAWQVPAHTSAGSHAFTLDLSSLGEGALSLDAVISDGHNSAMSATVTGALDRSAPSTVSDAPSGWGKAPLTVHLTATDPALADGTSGSGIAQTCWTLDGGSEGCTNTPPASVVLTAGTHELGFRSTDRAGNTEAEQTQTVRVDGTPPTTTDDAPVGWMHGPVLVGLTASDAESGVASTCYTLDGVMGCGNTVPVFGDGVHTLEYSSTDLAGNEETPHTVTVEIDDTPPTTMSDAPVGFVSAPVTVALTATDGGSGVARICYAIDAAAEFCDAATGTVTAFSTSATLGTDLDDGPHTITYHAVDNNGNAETTHTTTVDLDDTGPTTTAAVDPAVPTGGSGWYSTSPVKVTLNATDGDPADASGIAETCYELDGGSSTCNGDAATSPTVVSIDTDGAHTLRYDSRDGAGNLEAEHSLSIEIDTTAPRISPTLTPVKPQVDGSDWFQSVTVHFNCSDTTSGVAFCSHDIVLSDGANQTVSGLATDNAGNAASTTLAGLDVDGTAPVTSSDVASGWFAGVSKTVTLTASDAGSGVDRTCYVLDGGSQTCEASPVSVDVSGEGEHTLEFWSVDVAGNGESHHVLSIGLDATAPSTTVGNVPESGWFAGSSAMVRLTAADAGSGVARVCYVLDALPEACTSFDPAQPVLDVDVPVSGDGAHSLTFHAVDAAGNVESAQLLFFGLDGTAPVTSSDVASGWFAGVSKTVTLTASDAGSGVDRTCYVLDGGSQTCEASPVSVDVSGEGEHTLEFWSVDVAGNGESHHLLSIGLDATAPTASIDGTWDTTSGTIDIGCTASDALSGVDTVETQVGGSPPVSNCAPIGYPAGPGFAYDVIVSVSDNVGNLATVEATLFDDDGMLGCTPVQGADACGMIVTQ